jgi:succinoglycan biosynthesis protein ExoM
METSRTSIAVAVCTYRRNEPLAVLLDALLTCADQVRERAAVGVVVIDDTREGLARHVAERFADRFELGLTYKVSGQENISIARNLAVSTAMQIAAWTAMTDDDCEPDPAWLEALLDVQRRTGADAVTGAMVRRVPAGSPRWLTDEPFLELGMDHPADGANMPTAFTNNSMLSSRWLQQHPDIRFEPNLGKLGGEDMVFYRAARAAGLRIHFSERGYVYENEPPQRATLRYQLRRFFWHGNSAYVSSVSSGVRPARMLLHGLASLVRACVRPLRRTLNGERPQWRYSLASIVEALGKIVGFLGVRVSHQ